MWRLMRSFGFPFCLVSFPPKDLPFLVRFLNVKYAKKVEKGFLDTAVDYHGTQRRVELICDMTSDCLQRFTLSSAWNQKEKTQQSFIVQEVV